MTRLFQSTPSIAETLTELKSFGRTALAPHAVTVITGLHELEDPKVVRDSLLLYSKLSMKIRMEHAGVVASRLEDVDLGDEAFSALRKLPKADMHPEIAAALEAADKRRKQAKELERDVAAIKSQFDGQPEALLTELTKAREAVLVHFAQTIATFLDDVDEAIIRGALPLLQKLPQRVRSVYAEKIKATNKKLERLEHLRSSDPAVIDRELSSLLNTNPATLAPYASAVIALLDSTPPLQHAIDVVSRSGPGGLECLCCRACTPLDCVHVCAGFTGRTSCLTSLSFCTVRSGAATAAYNLSRCEASLELLVRLPST
jgi:hypothetical protein